MQTKKSKNRHKVFADFKASNASWTKNKILTADTVTAGKWERCAVSFYNQRLRELYSNESQKLCGLTTRQFGPKKVKASHVMGKEPFTSDKHARNQQKKAKKKRRN